MTHKFSVGDRVSYSAEGGTAIGGLVDGQDYLVQMQEVVIS